MTPLGSLLFLLATGIASSLDGWADTKVRCTYEDLFEILGDINIHALRGCEELSLPSVGGRSLTGQEAEALASALRHQRHSNITHIVLSGNRKIGTFSFRILMKVLPEACPQLLGLDVSSLPVGQHGAVSVAHVLRRSMTLRTLGVQMLAMGSAGAEAITTALLSRPSALFSLNMNGNNIQA